MSRKSQQQKEEQEQEQVWREVFDLFDKDSNGHITKDELGRVFHALDMDPTQKELDEAIKELDKDGNGVIEFQDFRLYMTKMKKLSYDERKQEMMRAFRIIDKNNDKFIDPHELIAMLKSLGEPLTEEEAAAMIRVADVNNDGKIDYEEFVDFILAPCLLPSPVTATIKTDSEDNTSGVPLNKRKRNDSPLHDSVSSSTHTPPNTTSTNNTKVSNFNPPTETEL